MKLRIQGNTFRFRIDAEDLDLLVNEGAVEVHSHVPSAEGVATLACAVTVAPAADSSRLELRPFGVCLRLSGADLDVLRDPSQESIAGRHQWDAGGQAGITEFLVEKDRLGGWPGTRRETIPL